VLAVLGSQTQGSQPPGEPVKPLSQLLAEYSRYVASGEINSVVADQAAATALVKASFAGRPGVSTDELDGLTVSAATWWFNLRPSNTEPLLRLNAEADTGAAMAAIRDEVLGLVRGTTDRSDSASPGDTVFPGESPDPGGRNPRGGKPDAN
jgi:phosphomannomutase